jgi:aminoglycoside phosphotransferase (APT) family kinase protein
VLRTRADTKELTEPQAADLSRCLADMLAAIHGVDVNQVGLADLGRGAGYLRRQLDRWQRQWELSATRDVPGYTELVERLTAALPAEGQTTLVHGDYRLDNALVTLDPEPRITAVVDWEMATLGDPLADLGLTLVYWTEDGEEGWLTPAGSPAGTRGVSTDATASPGFWTRAEFAAEYARLTGRDVSGIGYYVAFGYFKLAVVLEGIHARYQQGKTVGEGFEQEGFAAVAHRPCTPGPRRTAQHLTGPTLGAKPDNRTTAAPDQARRPAQHRPAFRCPAQHRLAVWCPALAGPALPGTRTITEPTEARRPAFAGPLDERTRHPGPWFTAGLKHSRFQNSAATSAAMAADTEASGGSTVIRAVVPPTPRRCSAYLRRPTLAPRATIRSSVR